MAKKAKSHLYSEQAENRKRRREKFAILFVGVFFCILTYIEIHISNLSQKLPFVNSIFFFGLVNFNIVLLLFLAFLLFRNIVKLFSERRGKLVGSSLKSKLVIAFTSFSFVPTILLFLVSVFYINSSFDKWFSIKIGGILQDSLEVTNSYYQTSKKKNYHFANTIAHQVALKRTKRAQAELAARLRDEYSLDVVEIYPGLFEDRQVFISNDSQLRQVPAVTLEFLQKGISQGIEASTIHQFADGNLIRCIVPIRAADFSNTPREIIGAVVVSSYVPLSLVSKMDLIATAFEDYKDVNPLKYPIKSIYLIILVLVTLIIFFGASWFGFHLARQLSTPLEALGEAAKDVALGKYKFVEVKTGSAEIAELIESFNRMTRDLRKSESNLRTHTRYMEIILSNISAGVVTLDQQGLITTINKYAAELLGIDPQELIGRNYNEVLRPEHRQIFKDLVGKMRIHRAHSIQRELKVNIGGAPRILQTTLSPLKDEKGGELGMVLVFDDLTQVVTAQRNEAWREVARRIAHEIKNPLTPIKLSAERLSKRFGDVVEDPTFNECTSTIIQQVDTLRDLVNEFSAFARLPQAKLGSNDLNQLIQESLPLYKEAHPEIQFSLNLDQNLPKIDLDPDQMKRVFVNLFENATAALQEVENPTVAISTHHDSVRKMVRVTVADNGSGIPDEIRPHIFEPYFSTKKEGTGLGLAIVKRIMDDHEGTIRVQENAPSGSRFIMELPLISKTQDTRMGPASQPQV